MIITISRQYFQLVPSECQTIWIQISSDILSGLIWVQTVYKSHMLMTKVTTIREIVNPPLPMESSIQYLSRIYNTIRVLNSLESDLCQSYCKDYQQTTKKTPLVEKNINSPLLIESSMKPQVYKTFFMLSSSEHEIYSANKC